VLLAVVCVRSLRRLWLALRLAVLTVAATVSFTCPLPRYAPEAAARFDARVPVLRGGRAWLLGAGLAAVLGIAFWLDYASGKSLYAAAASYHAYLELPVLPALVFASGVRK
jgi:ferric-dicitrate binding protein FerR (iron transport regulator)